MPITKQQIFETINDALEKMVEEYNDANGAEVDISVMNTTITIDGGFKHNVWDVNLDIAEV